VRTKEFENEFFDGGLTTLFSRSQRLSHVFLFSETLSILISYTRQRRQLIQLKNYPRNKLKMNSNSLKSRASSGCCVSIIISSQNTINSNFLLSEKVRR
jgi:hypothetical protein